jgi:hypothetical protein
MTNLYEETNKAISDFGYSWDDVVWIGSGTSKYPIDEFIAKAKETYYDSGFGSAEIDADLIVVFKDSTWLYRGEYDGSEWWNHTSLVPDEPSYTAHKFTLRQQW